MNDTDLIKPHIDNRINEPDVLKQQVINNENITGKPTGEPDFVSMMKLRDFFGIDTPSSKELDNLNNIYSFFNQRDVKSLNDVFREIIKVEQKIGSSPIGISRTRHIWNYLKVLSQIQEYEGLKTSYEGN